jgi:hypothetical protein
MNTNENNDASEDVIELGVASVETKGPSKMGEANGSGPTLLGISED